MAVACGKQAGLGAGDCLHVCTVVASNAHACVHARPPDLLSSDAVHALGAARASSSSVAACGLAFASACDRVCLCACVCM